MATTKSKTTQKTQPSGPKTIGVRPLMGYLLVEPLSADTKTASGIYLPESSQEKKSDQGTVIAVGDDMIAPDGRAFRSPVNKGDKVVYRKWGGDEIKVLGKEYKIVKFEDVMAVLED